MGEQSMDYKIQAKTARDTNQNIDIPNSTLEHATYLTDLLLENAAMNVRILTGSLHETFFEKTEILERFKSLVARRIPIQIVVWNKVNQQSCLDKIKATFGDGIKVKEAKADAVVQHFTVVDSKSYRLEEKHDIAINSTSEADFKVKGIANFNNPQFAKVLENIFDGVWNKLS